MVVGVKVGIIAFRVAEQFKCPVGDDLVGVHVGGSASTALNFIHNELLVKRTLTNFAAGLDDCFHPLPVKQAKLVIGEGGGLLHIGQSPDEIGVVADRYAGDLKVLHRARRVHAPINICRNFLRSEQIMLHARHAHFFLQ